MLTNCVQQVRLLFKLYIIWSVDSEEKSRKWLPDFIAKMHQIRLRLRLRPRPRWRSLQCSSGPLAGFEGPVSKGGKRGEGRGWKGWVRGGRRTGKGGREGRKRGREGRRERKDRGGEEKQGKGKNPLSKYLRMGLHKHYTKQQIGPS